MTKTAAEWRQQFREEQDENFRNMEERLEAMLLESENRMVELIRGLLQEKQDPSPPQQPQPPPHQPPPPPPQQQPRPPQPPPTQPPQSPSPPTRPPQPLPTQPPQSPSPPTQPPQSPSPPTQPPKQPPPTQPPQPPLQPAQPPPAFQPSMVIRHINKFSQPTSRTMGVRYDDFGFPIPQGQSIVISQPICSQTGYRQWDPGDEDEEDATGLSP